jgi:hypothetical protein
MSFGNQRAFGKIEEVNFSVTTHPNLFSSMFALIFALQPFFGQPILVAKRDTFVMFMP